MKSQFFSKSVLIVCAFLFAARPAVSQVVRFKVTSSDPVSIKHLQICPKGSRPCSNGLTDASGYVEMPVPPRAKPGDPITLEILNLPKDMVVISPRELRTFIPANESADGYIEIEIEHKNNGQALRSILPARKITQALNEQRANNILQRKPQDKEEAKLKDQLARQLEVSPSDIENATKYFLQNSESALDAGEAAFYNDDYQSAASLLRIALKSKHHDLSLNDQAHAWNLLGAAEEEIGDWDAALDNLRHAYTLNPSNVEYITDYVADLLLSGSPNDALEVTKRELQKPNSALSASDKFRLSVFVAGSQGSLSLQDASSIADELVKESIGLPTWQRALGLCLAAQFRIASNAREAAQALVKEASGIVLSDQDDDNLIAKAACLTADAMLSTTSEERIAKLIAAKKINEDEEVAAMFIDLLLGAAYVENNDYLKAESVFRKLFDGINKNNLRKSILGAQAVLGLSATLSEEGRDEEALSLIDSSSDILQVIKNMPVWEAVAEYAKGKFLAKLKRSREAIQELLKAQTGLITIGDLGFDMLLDSYARLGSSYADLRDYGNAERTYKKGLEFLGKSRKDYPREKGRLLNALGSIYTSAERYSDAAAVLSQSYDVVLAAAGTDIDEDVAVNLYYQGQLAKAKGDSTQSLQLVQRTFNIERQVLNPESVSFAQTEQELSRIEYEMFRYADAAKHIAHVCDIYSRIYGQADSRTVGARIDGVWITLGMGDFAKTRSEAEEIYAILNKATAYSGFEIDLSDVMLILAESNLALEDSKSARRWASDLLQFSDHYAESWMQIRSWLMEARIDLADKNSKSALEWVEKALDKCRSDSKKQTKRCILGGTLRAKVAYLDGDEDGALEFANDAISAYIRNHYDQSAELAESYILLADLWHRRGDMSKEKQALTNAFEIRRHNLGLEHSLTIEVRTRISALGN